VTELIGISLNDGLELLGKLTSEIIWYGKSLFLCAGCEQIFPNWRFYSTADEGFAEPTEKCRESSGRRVCLAFEPTTEVQSWAYENDAELLCPPRRLVRMIGNKQSLSSILHSAGVETIRSANYDKPDRRDAARIWAGFSHSPLVVQLPENNLTGMGTRLVTSQDELAQTLSEWSTSNLKISSYVFGNSLTVSGCVGPDATSVSGVSRQLVGLAPLTNIWGQHCGNQLLNGPTSTLDKCSYICKLVGDELRRRNFRGLFGLDLVQTQDNEIVVVEINPRIQSVTSLLNVAESETGLLPLPGVHILSFLLDSLSAYEHRSKKCLPLLSHMLLYAHESGRVRQVPSLGSYSLGDGILVKESSHCRLGLIGPGECVVWPFVRVGEPLVRGTKLAALQLRAPVVDDTNVLTAQARDWISALRLLFQIESEGHALV